MSPDASHDVIKQAYTERALKYHPDRRADESLEARERYRLSEVEAERQRAMAPFVEAESSGLYLGRELEIPKA